MLRSKSDIRFSLDSIIAILFFLSYTIVYISLVGRGDIVPYLLFGIWLIVISFKKNGLLPLLKLYSTRRAEITLLLLFFLYSLSTYLFITPTAKAFQFTLMPVSYFLVITMDSYYFLRDPRYKFTIFFTVCIALGLQSIISVPYVFSSAETVSRMYTSGELEGTELEEAMRHGVGSANFYASITGLFFIGIGTLGSIRNKALKFAMFVSLGFILLALLSASYNIVFWLLGTGMLILFFRSDWKKIKFLHVFLAAAIVIGLLVFYNLYLVNSQVFEPIVRKINLIKEGNLRDDGRIDLAGQSFNTFLEHPLFGIGVPDWGREKEIGEHLPWIDFPAHYGIVGFMPLLLFVIVIFKKNFNFYFRSSRTNLYASTCLVGYSVYVISNFVDPTIIEPPMFIMLLFFATSVNNRAERKSNFKTQLKKREQDFVYQ